MLSTQEGTQLQHPQKLIALHLHAGIQNPCAWSSGAAGLHVPYPHITTLQMP